MNLTSLLQLTGFSKTVLWVTDEGMSPTRTQFRKTAQTFHGPQGGSNDDTYWLDFHVTVEAKIEERILQDASAYFHVKPIFGGVFTDIVIWVFYPFNDGAWAKLEFMNLSLGKLVQHVGDREHVTLRVDNFKCELHNFFFSQHGWDQ
ncbi:hypothetical protein L2E82_03944 [Cichorium intybus]|uniref:Uncharacterized protein n=1 Tax=Cichorium intybus TaxID=13427 RepID=A0ACB9H4N5_CICIN|nr:hypothetical protein L2E82_03944 [Cichorium intybus]